MAVHVFVLCCLVLTCLLTFLNGLSQDHLTNYENLYELGMDAYRNEKYSKCISFFKSALDDYNFYTNTIIDCRLQCRNEFAEDEVHSYEMFFHDILLNANCLRRCKKKKLGVRPEGEVSITTDKKFEDRKPYNYLQFCYFKNGDYKEAAAAAYTFFITHQDDIRTIENLQYYKDLPNMTEEDFVDLERKPYQKSYIKGLLAYNDGKWTDSVHFFEQALASYFIEEEQCRAGCEGGLTHVGFPDFVNAIADHYVAVIVCQQKCLQKLSTFGMKELENFVAEHYNYLQYAYYESNNLNKAFESIASYLLFRPNDQDMLKNKEYYIKTLRHKEEEFTPSEAAVNYVKLWQEIDKSIDFVREKYILPRDDILSEEDEVSDKGSNSISVKKTRTFSDHKDRYMHRFSQVGIQLFAESKQLKGPHRFAADNLIREDQCESLADLARSKDTYEKGVKQVTVSEATKLIKEDIGYEISLRLLLRAGAIMSHYMSAYFNHSELLVVKDVKVICMTGGDHWADDKLSMECIPQEDGSCMKSTTSGNYWLIAYLTDISDGTGQFYFMDDEEKIQSYLQPKCGRIVGFAGSNKHGINMSWKRERCSIVMELSADASEVNKDLKVAADLLASLEEGRIKKEDDIDNSEILNEFYAQGVTVVSTGEDLLGKERFVADGLSTDTECDELIRLAKKEGVIGDGYRGNISPHTERELFTGLDMIRAKQKGVVQGDGYDNDQSNNPLGTRFVSPYTKYEKFEGLNISRSLKLVDAQSISVHALQLFLDVSENGRLLVEKYFNLSKPLYFDYTHLVCRTALDDDGSDRGEDLSHPVHSDNCMIQPDGSCIPDPLAYIQRHYSAVMYLNNDFEGGHFFFAHKNKSEQVSLKPKCGRLVAFNAGEYHGVKAVTKGQRCAIAMWYTHDPNYLEVSRLHAQRRLDRLSRKSPVSQLDSVSTSHLEVEEGEIGTDEMGVDSEINLPEKLIDNEEEEEEFHDEL